MSEVASRVKEGIKELFSSKDDLDYPDAYLNRYRGVYALNTKLPVLEFWVPMCCEKCQEKVKEEVEELDGVRDVICDQYNQRVTVTGFVDPLKALRKVKKVKKKSTFLNDSTHVDAARLPIESVPSTNALISESRYTTSPLIRANSSGFGRFPHEGHMAPMMRAPVVQAPIVQVPIVPQQVRRVHRHDGRPGDAFVPVDLQREYYGVRRMPSFKNYRYSDAEYISMGDEFRPGMTDTHYVPHHNQRPALLRPQLSFSRVPVTNPHYVKHIESEYY